MAIEPEFDAQSSQSRSDSKWVRVCLLVGILALLASVVFAFLRTRQPTYDGTNPWSQRISHIGMALLLYSNAHQGHLPQKLEDLVIDGCFLPDTIVYPGSTETPAQGGSPDELRAAYAVPGHNSYIYFGANHLAIDFGKDDVVVVDPPGRGEGGGSLALYGDGSCTFLSPNELANAIAATKAKLSKLVSSSQPGK